MYGAIIGDIVGSVYEFDNIKTKDFQFLNRYSSYTDDTIMTVAVAKALIKVQETKKSFKQYLIHEMQEMGRRFPSPEGGYGGRFYEWLFSQNPKPYNSFGNGSAMRVSPCGLIAVELEEALDLAKASAEVTHNHPEGIKGAQAVAASIFLAKTGKKKEEIKAYIEEHFYKLDKTMDEIRPVYRFNESCQGTVPEAITAFLESESYEDAVRNAISIGGDSDTIGAIAGSIAWTYYKYKEYYTVNNSIKIRYDRRGYALSADMEQHKVTVNDILPTDFVEAIDKFEKLCIARMGMYARAGMCSKISF